MILCVIRLNSELFQLFLEFFLAEIGHFVQILQHSSQKDSLRETLNNVLKLGARFRNLLPDSDDLSTQKSSPWCEYLFRGIPFSKEDK